MFKKSQKANKYLIRNILSCLMIVSTVGGIYLSQLISEDIPSKLTTISLLMILLFAIMAFYIITNKKELLDTRNKTLIVFFVYEFILLAIISLIKAPIYLLPISIGGMLVALIIDRNFAIMFNGFFSILAALLSATPIETLIFYLVSGTVACLIANYTKKRTNVVWVAFVLISLNIALILGIEYFMTHTMNYNYLIYGVLNASFSVIIMVGSLPLFEVLFDIITPTKLLEISNSDQKLIQKLLKDAPGTFHHSQWVANLSEMAAMDIGADYQLARAGALYHDIGKLKHPEYFKENQNGTNIHDTLEPSKSAEIILDHVTYGVQLANEYRLPKAIKNIIKQHHGTTLLKYFYYKAQDKIVKEEVNIQEYTYKGPLPQTNEAAIVMLADSVEAAVRSIQKNDKTTENIDKMIQQVIKSKFEEGQLEECNLMIKELKVIGEAFLKVYQGMDHDRI